MPDTHSDLPARKRGQQRGDDQAERQRADLAAERHEHDEESRGGQAMNFRVPRANLEGLYGSGPVGSPYLYAKDDPAKLLLSADGSDVPCNHEGIALIGDPRNDVHLFTSQMAVAFIKLHNTLVDRLREDETAEGELFEQARLALPARDRA